MSNSNDFSEFSFTVLSENDWEGYRQIRLESLELDPSAFGSNLERELAFTKEKWQSRLQQYSMNSKSITVGIKDETGKIIGIAGAYSKNTDGIEIFGVYITKKYRGCGLSKKLVKYLIDLLIEKNEFSHANLTVNSQQIPAVNLYKSLGFVEQSYSEQTLGDGKQYKVLYMELKL